MDTTEPIAPSEPQDNRRDLLSQQFDDVAAAPAETVPVEAAPARLRSEDGKFAANPVAAVEAASTEAIEEPVWKRAPASWKKDHHDVWNAADPRMQEYAYQREEQMRAGVEPLISKAQFADQMQEAVNPYMQTINGLGIDAPKAVKALLEADHALRYSNPQEKYNLFARLAQQYGVDLGNVSGLQQQQVADPQIYALQNELNNVRGEVQGWKNQQEQAQNATLLSEINKFSSKADHFEQARPTMINLLQSGMASTLDEAYEKAIRLDPELFDSVQSSRQVEVDAEKRKAADRAAKTARSSAVSVKSATPSAASSPKAQDRRSRLADQFDEISARL